MRIGSRRPDGRTTTTAAPGTAVAVLGVVVSAALLLGACGGSGGGGGTPTPSAPTSASAAVVRARRSLCHDLLLLQSGFRADALARLLPKLKRDVTAFRQAGDADGAAAVKDVVKDVRQLKAALTSGGDVRAATSKLDRDLGRLPGC